MTTKTAPQILAKLTWPQKRALHSGMHGDVATTRPTMGALRRLGLVGPESFNPRFAPLTVEGQKVLALMMGAHDMGEIHADALMDDAYRTKNRCVSCVKSPTHRVVFLHGGAVEVCGSHSFLAWGVTVSHVELVGESFPPRSAIAASPRFEVIKLGFRYYAVRDMKIGRNVRTMMGDAGAEARAERAAAELNDRDELAGIVLDALTGV